MAYRTILRSEPHQAGLEKEGVVVIPFLMEHNVDWIQEIVTELTYEVGNETAWISQTERLNEKLQSKVEYRCINCEPFHYELVRLRKASSKGEYQLFSAVTNELQHPSLRFIVPLQTSGEPFSVNYLRGAHTVSIAPRIDKRPDDFRQFEQEVLSNMKSIKIPPLEAAVIFSSMPHSISCPDTSIDTLVLIVTVLPYEAKANVVLPSDDRNLRRFKAYRTRYSEYVRWRCKDEIALNDMRPVISVDIPFPFDKESERNRIFNPKKGGVTFVGRLLKKLKR